MSKKLKMFTLFSLWAIAFVPVFPGLVESWFYHSDNSHGILVPLVGLYLVWAQRKSLKITQLSNSGWGGLVLFVSLALYVLAYVGGVTFVTRAMVVFSLAGLVLFLFGEKLFKPLSFPIFFLLFMVPVPDSVIGLVSFSLQLFATEVSAEIIKFLSIPVWREGNMLYFVQTQLEVAEACSGIRSVMSITMLSVLFVYLSKSHWPQKTIIFFSAIPVAVMGNVFRVSGTGVLAHFYGGQVARGFLHDFSGMAVFLFGLSALYFEYWLLNRYWKE